MDKKDKAIINILRSIRDENPDSDVPDDFWKSIQAWCLAKKLRKNKIVMKNGI